MICSRFEEWKKGRNTNRPYAMRTYTTHLLVTCLFSAMILAAIPQPIHADQDQSLEEILQGFDEEKIESEDNQTKKRLNNHQGTEAEEDIESIMEGFEKETEETDVISDEKKPSMFSLDGHLKHGISYNFAHDRPEPGETDWRGLSRFRPELQLELKARFSDAWRAQVIGKTYYDAVFEIRGRDQFTDEVLDNREKDAEFGESYILGSITDKLDIRSGRQIVVWGKSDNIRITDVLNPLDLREPGLVDIEDLRLPVTMTRIDYYLGGWNLSGLFLHEIRFNKRPAYGSDFFVGRHPPPPEVKPSDAAHNTEFGAALNGIFSGWDVAFYFADHFNKLPHQETRGDGQKELTHARLKMFGSAFNIAIENWLLKTEAAFLDGFKFFNAPGKSFSRIDTLVGFEYSGFHETTISFEVANRHLFEFEKALKQSPDAISEDEFQTAFRLVRDLLNDTLTVTVLAQTFGLLGNDGALLRISAKYDLTDSVEASGGVVFYESGDIRQFRGIGENDRLFFEIKYNF